ncbi:unnamed protein product [Prunus armeniaca]
MAAKVVPSAIVLQVLNQGNYEEWSFRVKTYLLAEDLWDVVKGTTTKPPKDGEADKIKDWKKRNAKALHAIQISCGVETFSLIRGISRAHVAWDTLAEKFKPAEVEREVEEPDEDLEGEAIDDGCENNASNDFDCYESFIWDLLFGRWNSAEEFLKTKPEAVRSRITPEGETALHVAVKSEELQVVKELVKLMTEKDLEIKDAYGLTAFACTVILGDIEMAKCMVEKNKKLLSIRSPPNNAIPLINAYRRGQWEMANYLYSLTPLEDLNDRDGAALISQCFLSKHFDIGWDLIQRRPNLATTIDYSGQSPLNALVCMRSAFASGSRLNLWRRWIYDCVQIPPMDMNNIRINMQPTEHDGNNQRSLIRSDMGLMRRLVTNLLEILGINRIYEMKVTHTRIFEFLRHMSKATSNLTDVGCVHTAIFQAVERGHVEFISHICRENPNLWGITDTKGRTIFHFAIERRREKVYNLIYELSEKRRKFVVGAVDKLGNTLLDLAVSFSPSTLMVQGAALQMKREIQWFKEVESIVPPKVLEAVTSKCGLTTQELFTKNHKELMAEGENSMKGAATSCTVVGALIVTIMFAAAFTVPGGNNQNTGFPIFLNERVFIIFIVSDAISLFSSTTSVMIFLGILTSRYAQEDFLKSLPTKMMLGLLALFSSIVAMMITFSCALIILLHGKFRIILPLILLASFPITSFIWMQFPFLAESFNSTYRGELFHKKIKRW